MADAAQKLYLASSFRHPGVAELILGDIEKQLKKAPAEIEVAYVITAGNLHPENQRSWIDDGREILKNRGCQVRDVDIEGKTEAEVAEEIKNADVIFVQGGNNFFLLEQMQKCNFEKLVKAALTKGVLYIGESAGSIVSCGDTYPHKYISTDKVGADSLENYHGMGLVNFLFKPHWNRERKREEYLNKIRENLDDFFSINQPIICLNDNQLVYVEGDKFQIWEASSNFVASAAWRKAVFEP